MHSKPSEVYRNIKLLVEAGKLRDVLFALQHIRVGSGDGSLEMSEHKYLNKIADYLYNEKLYTELSNFLTWFNSELSDFYNDGCAVNRLYYISDLMESGGDFTAVLLYRTLYDGMHNTRLKENLLTPSQVNLKKFVKPSQSF